MNKLVYAGALFASTTLLGALAFQMKEIAAGRDPVDMGQDGFWLKAAAQGGGLGFVGDLLLNDQSDDFGSYQWLFELLGPTAGSIADLGALTKGNYDQWRAGKDPKVAAEAVQFAKSHTPLINLWYTRAALDNAVLVSMQDALSPGYISRVRRRAMKNWGNQYWWTPGESAPSRAPDLGAVAGP